VPPTGWSWDPTLYAGSAAFYPLGRVPYPSELADRLAEAFDLDGSGHLLDVGCGPGSLTLLLAPRFARAVGVDADPEMLAEASRQATRAGVGNVEWRCLRAEELPAGLGRPTVITFAQSFHWMDRPRVAATARAMLADDGALVHVSATTHGGTTTDEVLPHPQPPREAIAALVREYLGDVRRAGRSTLPQGTAGDEDDVYRTAGFRGPQRLELPGRVLERSAAEVRASVYSHSGAAPHLFGADLDRFDGALRALLDGASSDGRFAEAFVGTRLDVWR
jgi:SAM-dependent methyltransferase